MDTVYGSKKYFQSLGTTDNDYYNRHSTPANRVMVSFSSFQCDHMSLLHFYFVAFENEKKKKCVAYTEIEYYKSKKNYIKSSRQKKN